MPFRVCCLVGPTDDVTLLGELAAVGVDCFQVRAKDRTDRELLRLAEVVVESVRPLGAGVVVDDRVDVALAVRADGVHLGADDLPVRTARALAPDLTIGATCRSAVEVRRAAVDGADYAGIGPVHPTVSKQGLPPALGLDAVRAARGGIPLVAIGGVDAGNAAAARAAGADGVAVIGAIWRQPDPVRSAKELVAALA